MKPGAGAYRYGFNGKENDNEVKGEGNQQDYGMRIYDPRLGRFLSVDPITNDYPSLTPYQFASNSPIKCVDVDGLEGDPVRGAIDWFHEQWVGLTSAERWTEAVTNVNETVNPIYFVANYGSKILTNKDLRGRPNDHRGRLGAASDFVAEGLMAWALGRTLGSYGTNTLEAEINTFNSSARLSKKTQSSPSQPALQITNEQKQELIAFVKQEASNGGQKIAAKMTTPQTAGPDFYKYMFTVAEDGSIMLRGKGMTGTVDFVVTNEGKLQIGRGHYFLSNEAGNVQAAGQLKIYEGKIHRINDLSGHYQPTSEETKNFGDILKAQGVDVSGAKLQVYEGAKVPKETIKL